MINVWILHAPSVSEVTAWINDYISQISRDICTCLRYPIDMIIVWILHVPSVSEVAAWINDYMPQISRDIYVYVCAIPSI